MRRNWVLGAVAASALLLAATNEAAAQDIGNWNIPAVELPVGDYAFHLGGQANGAAYGATQPAATNSSGVTGAATLSAKLDRTYDDGMTIALNGAFEIYHDHLSGDLYGDRLLEKLYANVQTGLGRIEIGQTDGAAHALAVTGPVVDDDVSLESSRTTFFLDPSLGAAFTKVFSVKTAPLASLNYAKLSYYSPRLFGLQLAMSFTPSESKEILPFISNGPHTPDRQDDIWDSAVSYSDYFGALSVGAFASLSVAHDGAKTTAHAGLTDWAIGSELDYSINDDMKLSAGGAFRQANAYAFDINSVFNSGTTRATHLSTMLTDGPWLIGAEYSDGTADGSATVPTLSVRGYQGSVGYVVNANLQLTAGWERLNYSRNAGAFYNGLPHIQMDAEFLHIRLHV
jgi:hypothetical protein